MIEQIGSLLRRTRVDDSGSVAVEFAMLALPFFMLVFGIFETGQVLWSSAQIEFHTDRIARLAAVDPDYSAGDAQSAITTALNDLNAATLNVTVEREAGLGAAPDMLVINVGYLYQPVTPFMFPHGFEISHSNNYPMVDNED